MSDLGPTQKKFEDHIGSHLNLVGYASTNNNDYGLNLCLIRDWVIEFTKSIQSEEWGRLTEIHDVDTRNKILSRIPLEISKRGVNDVLRNQAYFGQVQFT